jgi:predicted nucleic acid-binding protein
MKVLVDTNVILDVLLRRMPFYDNSRVVYDLVEQGRITGCISSSAITDIFYLTRRELKDIETIYKIVDALAADFSIAPVLESTITGALALRWNDFEDAVQFMTARENGVDYIITRNVSDFESTGIACISPRDFLGILKDAEPEKP